MVKKEVNSVKNRSEENGKRLYMILSIVLCAAAMCVVDAVIKPNYWIKSAIKVGLFLLVPSIYFLVNREELAQIKGLFRMRWKKTAWALALGVGVYGVIFGGYLLLRGTFDFSGIAGKLTADTGVSAKNFLYVSLYVSIVNSFLEELFFRGFGFLALKRVTSRKFAYGFSALLFAIYHGGMTAGYYHIGIFLLTLFALFVAGLMFNFLNEKSETIYPSWLVHMFANFGINTVGFLLFGMI